MAKKTKRKSVPHERSKASTHKRAKKSNKNRMILAAIAILIVAALGYYFFAMDKVIATVNGEKIYKSEVDEQYNGLKSQYGDFISYDIALNQTIIEKILMQEARKIGVSVSDESLDAFIADSLTRSGQTVSSFKATLKEQNLSYSGIRERIRVQLAITELVNRTFAEPSVTDAEARSFYNDNSDLFVGQEYSIVKQQIADYLKSQKQAKEFQSYVLTLRSTADVKTD